MRLNLNGVDSNGLKPLDAGIYDVICTEAKPADAKSTGNPLIKFTFQVSEGDFKGRNLYLNVTVLPQTMWKVKSTLEAILNEPLPSEEIDIDLSDCIGRPCRAKTTIEQYEGQDRDRVQAILPEGAGSRPATRPSLFS